MRVFIIVVNGSPEFAYAVESEARKHALSLNGETEVKPIELFLDKEIDRAIYSDHSYRSRG